MEGRACPEGMSPEQFEETQRIYAVPQLAAEQELWRMSCLMASNSLLKNSLLAFFNLAKLRAKLFAARKITTYVAILASHPCDAAASRLNRQAAKADDQMPGQAKFQLRDRVHRIGQSRCKMP